MVRRLHNILVDRGATPLWQYHHIHRFSEFPPSCQGSSHIVVTNVLFLLHIKQKGVKKVLKVWNYGIPVYGTRWHMHCGRQSGHTARTVILHSYHQQIPYYVTLAQNTENIRGHHHHLNTLLNHPRLVHPSNSHRKSRLSQLIHPSHH